MTSFLCLQFIKKLYAQCYDEPVAQALSVALCTSTRNQYEHWWKDFQQWLTSNPTKSVSKASIVLYLPNLAQSRELSPKTILVYWNSLKLPLLLCFNINTSDREFSVLARSQFIHKNHNHPPKRIIPAWNLNKVLSMLELPQYGNHRSTPSRLLMKTLFLIALASGNRVSEIAAFTRIGSSILPDSILSSYTRTRPWTDPLPNINLKALLNKDHSPHRLCPVNALRCWLAMSDPWDIDSIFINPKNLAKR